MRKPHIIRIHRPISRPHQNDRTQFLELHPHKLLTRTNHPVSKMHLNIVAGTRDDLHVITKIQIRSYTHRVVRLRTIISQPTSNIILRRIVNTLHRKGRPCHTKRCHPIPMVFHRRTHRPRHSRHKLLFQLRCPPANPRQITSSVTQLLNKRPPHRRLPNRLRCTSDIRQRLHPMPALTSPCHRPGLVTRMRRRRVQHAGGND